MPRAPARPKDCETVLKAVRERVGGKRAGQISKRENLRFIVAFAVEIKDDEGDAEKRLEDSLQDGETEFGQRGSLIFRHAGHHFLENNLRIRGDAELVEGISD